MSQLFSVVTTAVFAGLLATQITGQAVNQRATIFTSLNGAGQYLTVVENYRPNLASNGFSDRAYSTCVTGIWLFYDYINYNQGTGGLMEYVYGPNNKCVNFNNLGGKVSSMRFAGSAKDYRTSTITLYQTDYFQGSEEYIFQDQPNIALLEQRSLIVTGSSGWTLYDRPNYAGNTICVFPQDPQTYTPAFIYDLKNIGINPGVAIRSIRRGCYSKKIARPAATDSQGGSKLILLAGKTESTQEVSLDASFPLTNKVLAD